MQVISKGFEIRHSYRHLLLLTFLCMGEDGVVKAWFCTYRVISQQVQLRFSPGIFPLGICVHWSSCPPLMKD